MLNYEAYPRYVERLARFMDTLAEGNMSAESIDFQAMGIAPELIRHCKLERHISQGHGGLAEPEEYYVACLYRDAQKLRLEGPPQSEIPSKA